ncbi:hypothetical protein PRNP1_002356 [Phytophthora ramorum]
MGIVKTPIGWSRQQDQKPRSPKQTRKKQITSAQLFNLARRLAGVVAALVYASIGLKAANTTIDVLQGSYIEKQQFGTLESKLIVQYAGDRLIRDSPLVMQVLGGDTTPRNETLYLQSPTVTSFQACGEVDTFDSEIYSQSFLKSRFLSLMASSWYNLTFLRDLELILPVVDCTSPPLVTGDPSLLRAYSLVRVKNDPRDVRMISFSFSVQDYRIKEQSRRGPAVLSTFFCVDDMRATKVDQYFVVGLDYPYTSSPEFNVYTLDEISPDGFWEMSSVPRNASLEPIKRIRTARRRGFYLHAESEQANMRNLYWGVELESPARALSVWEWYGEPVIFDSWAWVHAIHLIFACQTLFSLGVLSIVVFRNLSMGKIWIGDAFAAISTSTLVIRAVLVLGSWYVNEYWTLVEFFLASANGITHAQRIPIHSELVHADLIVVFMSVFGLIGHLSKERIDPAFALIIFEVIHSYRQIIIRCVHPVVIAITEFSNAEYRLGIVPVTEAQRVLSPMHLWTTHQLDGINFRFIFISIFPKYVMISFVLGFVTARKLYQVFHRKSLGAVVTATSSTDRSANEKAATAQKGNLTNFEISTGAELEARYGLISDYKNYVFFKGLKFASADGVYCSGYVVANGRFLVGSKDLLSIIMIKAFRARFTNVYVYAVDGNTVQRTAQLVYPETLSWQDLISLNISILA